MAASTVHRISVAQAIAGRLVPRDKVNFDDMVITPLF
jgi:hypothetical protein